MIGAEAAEHAFARVLVQVAVDGFGMDAAYDQFICQGGWLCARAGKYQGTLDLFYLEETR